MSFPKNFFIGDATAAHQVEGANTDRPVMKNATREDELLTACNKWLLAHPESDEAKGGAKIGLSGENIDIANLL